MAMSGFTLLLFPDSFQTVYRMMMTDDWWLCLPTLRFFSQGFSVDGQENIQEILSKQLYLCQFLTALNIVRTGERITRLPPKPCPL